MISPLTVVHSRSARGSPISSAETTTGPSGQKVSMLVTLQPGDVVETGVDGIGTLRNPVVDAPG